MGNRAVQQNWGKRREGKMKGTDSTFQKLCCGHWKEMMGKVKWDLAGFSMVSSSSIKMIGIGL